MALLAVAFFSPPSTRTVSESLRWCWSPAPCIPQFLHFAPTRSEEHTSELQSPCNLVCRLLLEKKKRALAQRDRGIHPQHGGLYRGHARHISPGERTRVRPCRVLRRSDLRTQSKPALHADHGDERGDLPGLLHLGVGLSRRIPACYFAASDRSARDASANEACARAGSLRNDFGWRGVHTV